MTIQTLNIVAMFAAMYGSYLFVVNKFEAGAKVFLVGNAINVAVGLGIGDMGIVATQLALGWFTLPMYSNKKFTSCLSILAVALLAILGVTTEMHAHFTWASSIGAVTAIYGAYRMSKHDYVTMAWMWIIADLLFAYVGWVDALPGLFIQSSVFVYHGILRVTGKQLTDLIRFK